MHHAAVDGASGMEITAAIHDLERRPPEDEDGSGATREPRPSALKLLARAQINTLRQPLRFISVARNTVPGMAKAYLPCAGALRARRQGAAHALQRQRIVLPRLHGDQRVAV
jgi:hypothetical protein